MAIKNPYQNYRQNSVTTAGPEELVVLMYKGLEKNIKQGMLYIRQNNYEKANQVLLRGQDILNELMMSLDMSVGISHQLYTLYDFMLVNLRDGNVEKDCKKLKDVLGIITGLREAWEGALVSVRQIKYGK
jgi:flagellar protein FliS